MATDPETHELLEPLRAFLESLTDDLTQEKFLPAFREEIAEVRQSFESLSQSQETLEQISRGVDRLRDVFAPAGTRLLSGVKDFEQLLSQNVEQLQDYAGEILESLRKTHEELENSLRGEVESVQKSAAASREALRETTENVEQQLATLRNVVHVESEGESSGSEERNAALQEFLEAARRNFDEKSESLHTVLQEGLTSLSENNDERLGRFSEVLREVARSIGPKVREEIEAALEPLSTLFQAVDSDEKKKGGAKGRGAASQESGEASADAKSLVAKLAEFQQRNREGLSELQRVLTTAVEQLLDETVTHEKKSRESLASISSSLAGLEKRLEGIRKTGEKPAAVLQSLSEVILEQKKESAAGQADFFEKTKQQIADSQRTVSDVLGQIQSENTANAERVEAALQEIQGSLSENLEAEQAEIEKLFQHFSGEWEAKLSGKLDDVTGKIANLTEEFQGHLEKFSTNLTGEAQAQQERVEALEISIGEISGSLDELRRFSGEWKEKWTGNIGEMNGEFERLHEEFRNRFEELSSNHVDLRSEEQERAQELHQELQHLSGSLEKIHAAQKSCPGTLKNAIDRSYKETQEKLQKVIDGGYDRFLKQISTIPQSLERYASLLESLHQSDKLALDTISADCKTILKVANNEFLELESKHEALKKIFPLLERKLERQFHSIGDIQQNTETLDDTLQTVKKNLQEAQNSLTDLLNDQKDQTAELADRTARNLSDVASSLEELRSDIKKLRENTLVVIQRELTDFVTSKFEFMEKALVDHHTAIKTEYAAQFEQYNRERRKGLLWLLVLVGFGIALQLLIHFITNGPLAPPMP